MDEKGGKKSEERTEIMHSTHQKVLDTTSREALFLLTVKCHLSHENPRFLLIFFTRIKALNKTM